MHKIINRITDRIQTNFSVEFSYLKHLKWEMKFKRLKKQVFCKLLNAISGKAE